jgi:hypothetical protein
MDHQRLIVESLRLILKQRGGTGKAYPLLTLRPTLFDLYGSHWYFHMNLRRPDPRASETSWSQGGYLWNYERLHLEQHHVGNIYQVPTYMDDGGAELSMGGGGRSESFRPPPRHVQFCTPLSG